METLSRCFGPFLVHLTSAAQVHGMTLLGHGHLHHGAANKNVNVGGNEINVHNNAQDRF